MSFSGQREGGMRGCIQLRAESEVRDERPSDASIAAEMACGGGDKGQAPDRDSSRDVRSGEGA